MTSQTSSISNVHCSKNNRSKGNCSKPFIIGILMGDRSNLFWTHMEEDYNEQARAYNLEVTAFWGSPEKDPNAQAGMFDQMIGKGFDAVIINPITNHNLAKGIDRATRLGIPIFDVGAKTDPAFLKGIPTGYYPVNTVDFFQQGQMGGRYILENLTPVNHGKVVVMRGRKNAAQSKGRIAGAMEVLGQSCDISLIESPPADFDRTKACVIASQLLEEHPDINAFFCANDLMALGVSDAIKNIKNDKMMLIVGVDGTKEARTAIKNNILSATIAFSTTQVAKLLLEIVVNLLKGMPVMTPGRIESTLISGRMQNWG